MSTPGQDAGAAAAIAKAEDQLKFIEELRKTAAFDRYFLARIREKRDALRARVMEQDDLSPEERERLRRIWKEYGELLKMMDTDEATAVKAVRAV